VTSDIGSHGVVDVMSLFQMNLLDPQNEMSPEMLRSAVNDMEICIMDLNGNVIAGSGCQVNVNGSGISWNYAPPKAGQFVVGLKHRV
jgi:hypothetical protein